MENTQVKPNLKKYDIVKHRLFKDVACQIEHVYSDGTVCVSWINQGFVESRPLRRGVEFLTLTEDWLVCNNPEMKSVRYSTWRKYDK